MELDQQTIEEMKADYEARIRRAAKAMFAATDAESFLRAEQENLRLALENADRLTSMALSQMACDPERVERACTGVRRRAHAKKIKMISRGRRSTEVQLIGGSRVKVTSPYMCAEPGGTQPRESRGSAGTGVYPVLDELGIRDRSTPGLRLRVAHAVCEANSVTAARELMAQSGLRMSHTAALRLTYAVGSTAVSARQKLAKAERVEAVDNVFADRDVVLCIDGGRVRTRRRTAGRPRKGGRKHFVRDWREPKVLTLYVRDANGRKNRKVASIIDATLGNADAAFQLARYHLLRLGGASARSLTIVGDGARWIWKRAPELGSELLNPEAGYQEIVDYFHAVERLHEFARSRPGWSEKRALQWVNQQKSRLKRGWADRIARSMRKLLTSAEQKGEEDPAGYFERNADRMKYGDFRAAGLPCGSGAVESAVRRVVNMRMKSASVVWTHEHAEEMLHLRAFSKAGRWFEIEQAICRRGSWNPKRRRAHRRTQPKQNRPKQNGRSSAP